MGKDAVENNLRQVIKDLQRRVGALERGGTGDGGRGAMAASFPTLSDITPDAGLLRAGEFRAGNGVEPGEGFSGVRMTADGVNGYDNDVLQAGMSATDGSFVFGVNHKLNADGVNIKVPDGISNFNSLYAYKFYDAGDNYVGSLYYYPGHLAVENVYSSGSSDVSMRARAADGKTASATLSAQQYDNSTPPAYFSAALDGSNVGTVEISAGINGTITIGRANSTTDIPINGTLNCGDTYSIKGGGETIADDDVFSFTPATLRGVLILRGQGSESTTYAMLTYAAIAGTAYAYAWAQGSNTVVTTGALSGTTGTDGKLTISAHTDGKIYIENRRGSSRAVAWQIVAGSVA